MKMEMEHIDDCIIEKLGSIWCYHDLHMSGKAFRCDGAENDWDLLVRNKSTLSLNMW
jgi:hypothetical protein